MENYWNDIPCVFYSSGDDGMIVDVNSTLCNQLGYTKQELTGQKQELIFTLPTRIFHQTHFFPLLKIQGHVEEIYITLQTKSGEHLPVLINAERKEVNGRWISLCAGIVVHHRKKFEDELIAAKKAAETALHQNTALLQAKQDLQIRAEQLDRLMHLVRKHNAELRQFNHAVTHSLQEPLRKLFLFSSMLPDTDDTQAHKKTVQRIKSVSEQMRSILSGLQQYVWLTEDTVNTDKVNLDTLLQLVKEQLEKENGADVLCIEAEQLPQIEANREQMHFLLHQLLSNAIRFRKPGIKAHVKISATNLLQNKFRQVPEKYKYIDFIKLQVEDNGVGFDNTYKEQVFELFRKLHSSDSRGIGLSLCKQIVENHQGTISINSTKDVGTAVSILLPVRQDKNEAFAKNEEDIINPIRNDT